MILLANELLVQRRVYFMDHMEYLQSFAKKDRINISLRNLLRTMTKLSGIRTSETCIDEQLENMPNSRAAPAVAEPHTPVQRDEVLSISEACSNRCPKHRAYMKSIQKTPEYQTWLSNIKKGLWHNDAYRSKTIAGMLRGWEGNDERRAVLSARTLEWWQDEDHVASISAKRVEMWTRPDYREKVMKAQANAKTFRRDINNPHWTKLWNRSVQVANEFAVGLDAAELETHFFRAFTILHLDPSHYGISIPTSFVYSNASRGVAADFFARAGAGGPWYSPDDIGDLMEEHKWTRANTENKIRRERQIWLRSAAILSLKGISVDCTSIPHLAWMA